MGRYKTIYKNKMTVSKTDPENRYKYTGQIHAENCTLKIDRI